uniref:G_PROTEIN_RECEP_F1_2 domain-containing protein n=1 Tax=Rhabditophanes sp. KR3021 TaxID=114890 RepID=A0AC35UD07_9BILA
MNYLPLEMYKNLEFYASILVFCISVVSNILALSFYKHYRENGSTNPYIKMLWFQLSFDIFFAIVSIICRQDEIIVPGYLTFHLANFDSFHLSRQIHGYIIAMAFFAMYGNINNCTLVIILRYIQSSGLIKLRNRHLFLAVFITLLIPGILAFNLWNSFDYTLPANLVYLSDLKSGTVDPGMTINSISCSVPLKGPLFYIMMLGFFGYLGANYILVVFIFFKYRQYFIKFSKSMSVSTRTIHQEFTRILALQAFAPIIIAGLPIMAYLGSIFLDLNFRIGGTIILFLLSLTPACNGLLFVFLSSKNIKILKRRLSTLVNFIFCKNLVQVSPKISKVFHSTRVSTKKNAPSTGPSAVHFNG